MWSHCILIPPSHGDDCASVKPIAKPSERRKRSEVYEALAALNLYLRIIVTNFLRHLTHVSLMESQTIMASHKLETTGMNSIVQMWRKNVTKQLQASHVETIPIMYGRTLDIQ